MNGMRISLCAVLAALPGAAAADWDAAVTTLAAEKTRAETCVAVFKRHAGDDPGALSRGELAYAEAKAEVDAVIAALALSLAKGAEIAEFDAVLARLEKGVRAREAFCARTLEFVEDDPGTRSAISEIIGNAIAAVIEAAKDIYIYHREENVLERRTIQAQIEAKTWDDFSDISPAS